MLCWGVSMKSFDKNKTPSKTLLFSFSRKCSLHCLNSRLPVFCHFDCSGTKDRHGAWLGRDFNLTSCFLAGKGRIKGSRDGFVVTFCCSSEVMEKLCSAAGGWSQLLSFPTGNMGMCGTKARSPWRAEGRGQEESQIPLIRAWGFCASPVAEGRVSCSRSINASFLPGRWEWIWKWKWLCINQVNFDGCSLTGASETAGEPWHIPAVLWNKSWG